MNNDISQLLIFLGIGPEKKGFTYLTLVVKHMSGAPTTTLKSAYKKIEPYQNANACTIDSSIRNVIHAAFYSGKLIRLNAKMGMDVIDKNVCPTNKAFVSLLIRCLKSHDDSDNDSIA